MWIWVVPLVLVATGALLVALGARACRAATRSLSSAMSGVRRIERRAGELEAAAGASARRSWGDGQRH